MKKITQIKSILLKQWNFKNLKRMIKSFINVQSTGILCFVSHVMNLNLKLNNFISMYSVTVLNL